MNLPYKWPWKHSRKSIWNDSIQTRSKRKKKRKKNAILAFSCECCQRVQFFYRLNGKKEKKNTQVKRGAMRQEKETKSKENHAYTCIYDTHISCFFYDFALLLLLLLSLFSSLCPVKVFFSLLLCVFIIVSSSYFFSSFASCWLLCIISCDVCSIIHNTIMRDLRNVWAVKFQWI